MNPEPLLAAWPAETLWLGDDEVLRRGRLGDVVVPARHAALLEAMSRFLPRDAHAAELAAVLGTSPLRAGRVIDELLQRGLVAPADAFIGGDSGEPSAPLPEPLFVIRAYRRPEGLERLLRSALADERRHGAARRYLVIDDTDDAACAAGTTDIAQAFARESRSHVSLITRDARNALLDRLETHVDATDRGALRELLDPRVPTTTMGARSWNLGVLCAAGGLVGFLDDDTSFPLRLPPGARTAFEPRNSVVAQSRFLDDRDFDGIEPLATEPVAWLSRYLGRSPRALFARDGWRVEELAGRPVSALAHLRAGVPALAVSGGVWGGLAFNSSAWLNGAPPETLADLWREPYRHERLEADALWHATLAPRLVDHAYYAPLLCDARELLPFVGTYGLADDSFFLSLLAALVPQPVFALVPAMLGHLPFEHRNRLARSREPLLLDRNGLVGNLFGEVAKSLRGSDRAARLAAIGAHCADLAAASRAALEERIVRWSQPALANLVEQVSATLGDSPHAPSAWREHAARVVAVNRNAMVSMRLDDEGERLWRALLRQCASACRLWPRLWQVAREQPLLEGLALE